MLRDGGVVCACVVGVLWWVCVCVSIVKVQDLQYIHEPRLAILSRTASAYSEDSNDPVITMSSVSAPSTCIGFTNPNHRDLLL